MKEPERNQFLREAMQAVSKILNPSERGEAPAAVVPSLPALFALEVLDGCRIIEDPFQRAETIKSIAEKISELPSDVLYPLLRNILLTPVDRTRGTLLLDLRALAPVIAALGGAESLADLFTAVREVGEWWP